MKTVSPNQLNDWLKQNEIDIKVIDIREPYEYEYSSIKESISIPMSTLLDRIEETEKGDKIVMHCRTGKRAAAMIDYLEVHHKLPNLYNLTGGILAWSEEVDPSSTPC